MTKMNRIHVIDSHTGGEPAESGSKLPHSTHVIDSHTAGEPTRIIISGGPLLSGGTTAEKLDFLRRHHDLFRSAVVNEPRGSDVLVGGMLVEPANKACVAGVIFFNNVGYLGMCGHGAIGLMATLAHLGRIKPGKSWPDHTIVEC